MQGKSYSLRLGLTALVVVLIFGALGSLSLARDAFDDDYDDCPARTRLDAVDGLTIDRTDEDDEIRISWDALDQRALDSLGANGFKARLTIIVDDGDDTVDANVALGDTSKVFDEIDFTKELDISVAVTLGDYVISDIAVAEFVSGMPAPSFKSDVLVSTGEATPVALKSRDQTDDPDNLETVGSFYYLGFNDLFDNWYVTDKGTQDIKTSPVNAKFRVGLVHGNGELEPDDADFENYRITIEDSNGDLLGYQAETVAAGRTYGDDTIWFGATSTLFSDVNKSRLLEDDFDVDGNKFVNIRLSNQVDDGALSPYYVKEPAAGTAEGLSYGNVFPGSPPKLDPVDTTVLILFVEPPVEYFDFPHDVFEDDGSYTIKAWAEDDEGTRISPQASITLNVQERDDVEGAAFSGASGSDAKRYWDSDPADGVTLRQYGFSIQDE